VAEEEEEEEDKDKEEDEEEVRPPQPGPAPWITVGGQACSDSNHMATFPPRRAALTIRHRDMHRPRAKDVVVLVNGAAPTLTTTTTTTTTTTLALEWAARTSAKALTRTASSTANPGISGRM
jgi:hypothetical protein